MGKRTMTVTLLSGVLILSACGDGGSGGADTGQTGGGADGGGGSDGVSTRVGLRTLGDRASFFSELRGALIAQNDSSRGLGVAVDESTVDAGAGDGGTTGGGAGLESAPSATSDSDASSGEFGGSNVTSTNVQEVGVDEQDRVKVSADGSRLYVLQSEYPTDVYPLEGGPVPIDDIDTGESVEIEIGDIDLGLVDPIGTSLSMPDRVRTTLRVLDLDASTPDASPLRDLDLDLGGRTAQGMYLYESGDAQRVVLTSSSNGYWSYWGDWAYPGAFGGIDSAVTRVDVDDPDAASISGSLGFDGQIVSSRRIGKHLFLALRFYPYLPGPQPYELTADAWRDAVNGADDDTLLPHVTDVASGERRPLIAPDGCFVAERAADTQWYSPDIVTLAVVDLDSMTIADSECFLGATETLYASPDAVYLATTRWGYGYRGDSSVETDIHQFDLDGGALDYRGSGSVRGHLGFDDLRKPFRLSEKDGYLRVATVNEQGGFGFADGFADGGFIEGGSGGDVAVSVGTDSESSNPASFDIGPISLTVLTPDGEGRLIRVAELPNPSQPEPIGKPGEQLYASRFLGDRAYLVSFRQTDPLYVVDLSDPRSPALAGELEIEGYSDYLLPIDENHLLGIGRDALATEGSGGEPDGRGGFVLGVKLSLFDVSDPSTPREADTLLVGQRGTESSALFDHRAITVQRATDDHPTRVSFSIDVAGTAFPQSRPTLNDPLNYYGWAYSGLHGFDVHAGSGARIESRGAMVVERVGPTDGYYGPRYRDSRAVMVDDATFYVHGPDVYATTWDDLAQPGPAR